MHQTNMLISIYLTMLSVAQNICCWVKNIEKMSSGILVSDILSTIEKIEMGGACSAYGEGRGVYRVL